METPTFHWVLLKIPQMERLHEGRDCHAFILLLNITERENACTRVLECMSEQKLMHVNKSFTESWIDVKALVFLILDFQSYRYIQIWWIVWSICSCACPKTPGIGHAVLFLRAAVSRSGPWISCIRIENYDQGLLWFIELPIIFHSVL